MSLFIAVGGLPRRREHDVFAQRTMCFQLCVGLEVMRGSMEVLTVSLRGSALEITVDARGLSIVLAIIIGDVECCAEFSLSEEREEPTPPPFLLRSLLLS